MAVRRRVRKAALAVLACLGILGSLLAPEPVGAAAASPTVTPATGGGGIPVVPGFTAFDLATVGYQQSEVFLSGAAHAYAPASPLGPDGQFDVAESAAAPYTTRAVVVRPIQKHRFNGTVVVEWLKFSGGADAGPDWILAHNQLVRQGFAWVGVSAEKVGVDALRSDDPLRGDAVRYAGLSHPGDSFSYDIFSQAAQAIRDNPRAVLGGLRAQHVLAVGESQSAGLLVTYIDAVHPWPRSTTASWCTAARPAAPRWPSRPRAPCPSRRRHPSATTSVCPCSCSRPRPTCCSPTWAPASRTPTCTGYGRWRGPRTSASTG
jgi:Alpha/beta hydrolase domain